MTTSWAEAVAVRVLGQIAGGAGRRHGAWRRVPGYPAYEVSDEGQVRRKTVHGEYRILRHGSFGPGGYAQVRLCSGGVGKMFTVHRLVALAFIGPRPAGYHIDHLDSDKTNNRRSNLEYVTPRENLLRALARRMPDSSEVLP